MKRKLYNWLCDHPFFSEANEDWNAAHKEGYKAGRRDYDEEISRFVLVPTGSARYIATALEASADRGDLYEATKLRQLLGE